ncbi:MAG: GNAT family N-acetyltransferase [Bacteroidota bacterium]
MFDSKEIEVRYAIDADLGWLLENDNISKNFAERYIHHNEYIIALKTEIPVGFLRYSLFWSKVPYMDMIKVSQEYQKLGVGSAMLAFWETQMRSQNYKVLMTSSEKYEREPQVWHIRNGFEESGELTLGNYQKTAEVFFVKNLEA